MIEEIKVDYPGTNIEWMQHDYFTPQPVHGADVYFYRFVFHNLSDEKAVETLRAAVPALKKGAKILVNGEILPEPGTIRWRNERAIRGLDAIVRFISTIFGVLLIVIDACMCEWPRERGE
jgi:hypothetical protein